MSYDRIYEIDIQTIEISKLNVRHSNPLKDIDELAASIKKHGLLQPVVLLGSHDNPPYSLIAGQRRFLAHQILKKKTIRAVFADSLSDQQAKLRSLVENLQRVELNHADIAEAITSLYEEFSSDDRKVAKETGLTLRKVRDYIKIEAQASDKMKNKLRENKVQPSDVKRALKAAQGNIRKAEELIDLMEEYPLTKHQKKRVIEYGESHVRASASKILEEAMRPRVEQSIMVSLPEDIRKALEKATKEFSQEPEEIVTDVLKKWLVVQGFIDK